MCYSHSMQTIATHSGKFHADDVFAVATLLLSLKPKSPVLVRTRDPEQLKTADFVVDVGGIYDPKAYRFDHHQVGGAGKRQSDIPYAAFGLVWKEFGTELSGSDEVALRVDEVLVAPIDANDNGVNLSVPKHTIAPYDISDAVRSFIPTWQEGDEGHDAAFDEAVALARRIIEREIKRAQAVVASREKVGEAYERAADKRLIILDEDHSWKDAISSFPEPLYVIHPQNGTWRIYAVRDNPHVFMNRKDLPASWKGLRDAEFALATGVADALFCHRNLFMAVAGSKEGALKLARAALAS